MNKFSKSLSDDSGQMLVGTIVATTVMVGALYAAGTAFRSSSRAQASLQSRQDTSDLARTLRMIIDNPALCGKAFWNSERRNGAVEPQPAYFDLPAGTPDADKKIFSLIRFGGTPLVTLGTRIDAQTSVKSLGLGEVDPLARQSFTSGATNYVVKLLVTMERDEAQTLGGTRDIQLPLFIQTNAGHQITACGTTPPPDPSGPTNAGGCIVRAATAQNTSYISSGARSTAYCNAGENATSGGLIVVNASGQGNYAVVDGEFRPKAWTGTMVGTTGGVGSILPGQPSPRPFRPAGWERDISIYCFPNSGGTPSCLTAVVTCCK